MLDFLVHPLIEDNREAIARLCRLHGVHRLEAFGSILRDDFDAGHSDVDVLIEFNAQAADSFERSTIAGCAIASSRANHRSIPQHDCPLQRHCSKSARAGIEQRAMRQIPLIKYLAPTRITPIVTLSKADCYAA